MEGLPVKSNKMTARIKPSNPDNKSTSCKNISNRNQASRMKQFQHNIHQKREPFIPPVPLLLSCSSFQVRRSFQTLPVPDSLYPCAGSLFPAQDHAQTSAPARTGMQTPSASDRLPSGSSLRTWQSDSNSYLSSHKLYPKWYILSTRTNFYTLLGIFSAFSNIKADIGRKLRFPRHPVQRQVQYPAGFQTNIPSEHAIDLTSSSIFSSA